MEIKTYKRRHEQYVRAAKFEGGIENGRDLCGWMGGGSSYIPPTNEDPREYLSIPTVFGSRTAKVGSWIVESEDKTYLPYRASSFEAEYEVVDDEESRLVAHARRELNMFPEEDPDFIESIMNTVKAFSQYKGHSGSSASIAIQMVTALLNGRNLFPLTDDPEEWEYHEGAYYGDNIPDMWQNRRNSSALTEDATLRTYYLVDEKTNEDGSKVMHTTWHKEQTSETDLPGV